MGKATDRAFTADAPVCGLCRWRFQYFQFGGVVLASVAGLAIYAIAGDMLLAHLTKRASAFVIGLAVLPIAIVWTFYFQPPLELKAVADEIQYKFTNEVFKNEFVRLNPRPESPIDALERSFGEDPPG